MQKKAQATRVSRLAKVKEDARAASNGQKLVEVRASLLSGEETGMKETLGA
jgi:hypothetical protein